jgi:hypothetical protein
MNLGLTTDGLLPVGIHPCTPETVLELFVLNFPDSQTRRHLFRQWEIYNQRLKQKIGDDILVQWVNGSFVTAKINPGDIDCVTFVPYESYQRAEDSLLEFYTTISLYDNGLDAYLCPVYDLNDNRHPEYRQRCSDWSFLFGQLRDSTLQKGFLELSF